MSALAADGERAAKERLNNGRTSCRILSAQPGCPYDLANTWPTWDRRVRDDRRQYRVGPDRFLTRGASAPDNVTDKQQDHRQLWRGSIDRPGQGYDSGGRAGAAGRQALPGPLAGNRFAY